MFDLISQYISIDNPFFLFQAIAGTWWVWLPMILWTILKTLYYDYIRGNWISKNLEFVLLEIVLEKGEEKTPKSMEQFLTTLHGGQSSYSWWETNVEGALPDMFSLEMVSIGGSLHFLIRTHTKYRKMVESGIYAAFPEVEITEVSDYTKGYTNDKLEVEYDVFGLDLGMSKNDAYPIRTYQQFLDPNIDAKINDPLSQVLEVMSNIEPTEQVWLQLPIVPLDDSWTKVSKKELDKILERGSEDKRTFLDKYIAPIIEFISFGLVPAPKPPTPKEQKFGVDQNLTPGKKNMIEVIESSMTKPGFLTAFRIIYIAPKSIFNPSPVKSVISALQQFNDSTLNSFKPDDKTIPSVSDFFNRPQRGLERLKKILLLDNYIKRKIASTKFIFNTEELTTIFHFPGGSVTTSTLKRVQAKKANPPIGLPIIDS
jgi:hypothetical protein